MDIEEIKEFARDVHAQAIQPKVADIATRLKNLYEVSADQAEAIAYEVWQKEGRRRDDQIEFATAAARYCRDCGLPLSMTLGELVESLAEQVNDSSWGNDLSWDAAKLFSAHESGLLGEILDSEMSIEFHISRLKISLGMSPWE